MDEAEKMILEDLRSEIKTINKNILYLCKHTTNSESRLENIERSVIIYDKNTNSHSKQISELKGKFIGASMFVTIVISSVISIIM